MAADRMNRTGQTHYERIRVLKALRLHGRSTAKRLDRVMPVVELTWDGWAHRRMKELVDMGLVERTKTGREMVCSLTEEGKKVIT
jgi:predicted transcriptional regulator